MHFLALVTGDDVDAALDPFDENLDVDPWRDDLDDEAWLEALQSELEYRETLDQVTDPASAELLAQVREFTAADLAADRDRRLRVAVMACTVVGDLSGEQWRVDPQTEQVYALRTYNRDGVWDWYEVGGRWSGCLVLTEEASARIAQDTSVVEDRSEDPFAARTRVNSARIGDVDWAASWTPYGVLHAGAWTWAEGDVRWPSLGADKGEWEKVLEQRHANAAAFASRFAQFMAGFDADLRVAAVDYHS